MWCAAYMLQGRISLVVCDQSLDCRDRFIILHLKKKFFSQISSPNIISSTYLSFSYRPLSIPKKLSRPQTIEEKKDGGKNDIIRTLLAGDLKTDACSCSWMKRARAGPGEKRGRSICHAAGKLSTPPATPSPPTGASPTRFCSFLLSFLYKKVRLIYTIQLVL